MNIIKQTVQTSYSLLWAWNLKEYRWTKLPSFLFWGLNICVGFDLRDSKKIENINKLNKIILHNKNIDIHKTAYPHSWNPGFKAGFQNDTLS